MRTASIRWATPARCHGMRLDIVKSWFITGASSGLGLKIARLALARGDNVVATARRRSAITKAMGSRRNLLALPLDTTDGTQARATIATAVARFGAIDILINNISSASPDAADKGDDDDKGRIFRTNVLGLLTTTRAALPHMRARRSGHILNICCVDDDHTGSASGACDAARFAVEEVSKSLLADLASRDIQLTVVAPGHCSTIFPDVGSPDVDLDSLARLLVMFTDERFNLGRHAKSGSHRTGSTTI